MDLMDFSYSLPIWFSQSLGAEHRGYTASRGAGRVIQNGDLMLSSQPNSLES